MSESSSPPSRPVIEAFRRAPRESSLVYRGHPRRTGSGSDVRPQPTLDDKRVRTYFDEVNGVREDCCWVTGLLDPQSAHVLPHAENGCTRVVSSRQLRRGMQ